MPVMGLVLWMPSLPPSALVGMASPGFVKLALPAARLARRTCCQKATLSSVAVVEL